LEGSLLGWRQTARRSQNAHLRQLQDFTTKHTTAEFLRHCSSFSSAMLDEYRKKDVWQ